MKKKGQIITLSVIGVFVALVLLLFAVIILSGNQITVARCIAMNNGGLYMVYDERPVHLSFNGDKEYETGDTKLFKSRKSRASGNKLLIV